MQRLPVDSIILAGGESKRMGKDKAFLSLCGKPFIQIIAEELSKYSNKIIVSVNKDKNLYVDYLKNVNVEVVYVKDSYPYTGPLNGIISCISEIKSEFVFVATCDTPMLKGKLLPFFLKKIHGYQAVIPEVGGKLQFLNTLYEKPAIDAAEELYKKGVRSLHRWVKSINTLKIGQKEVENIDPHLCSY
ncbi:MAG: molybdenum cofactor guanylyltransferase [Persephonella sp.]|nr:molybdenum cofactor guanylyltransferase [Persephonella sp.]